MNQQSKSERQNIYVGVGVMKDYKLKLRNLLVSHTLSWNLHTLYTLSTGFKVVHYKSRKRELKAKLMNESVR